MVETQIRGRGVGDPSVLEAMAQVPRHLFVPEDLAPFAYADEPLPIGLGQTISQPYIVAYMTEALRLKRGEKVLEVGTGSGYQTAVLAEVGGSVWTIELVGGLSLRAQETLNALGYSNIRYRIGDGSRGWPEEAPFDAILVTAAAAEIPEALENELAPGGRMIIPVGVENQILVLVTRRGAHLSRRDLLGVRFVPLIQGGTRDPMIN
jgi:protein-L-isoaspartate(D-aspartate) O-methyltransferase